VRGGRCKGCECKRGFAGLSSCSFFSCSSFAGKGRPTRGEGYHGVKKLDFLGKELTRENETETFINYYYYYISFLKSPSKRR
jgi:hypothetical protein